MAMLAKKISRGGSKNAVSSNGLANPASADAAGKRLTRRAAARATSSSSAKAANKIAADKKREERRLNAEIKKKEKDERLRIKETKQNETDDRFTSPDFIRIIEDAFGKIDFDPCWHENSAVEPKAYLDVRKGHNGLRDAWSGPFVFVNPPWSAQDKWVRRAHYHWTSGSAHTVVCLLPAKTDTVFFHKTLIKDADLYFIEGRLRFFKKDKTFEGTKVATMLVIFGATDQQKKRLAELVRGTWCSPSRPSSARTKKAAVSLVKLAKHRGLSSCTAPFIDNDANWTVLCNPTVGRGPTARLA